MREEIVISDTNIFIDLCKCELVDDFFKIGFSVRTLDFVIAEIIDKRQKELIQSHLRSGDLSVKEHTGEEIEQVIRYKGYQDTRKGLSLTDCAVILYAKSTRGSAILSGDRALKMQAESEGITVFGILFIIRKLVEEGIMTRKAAADKLEFLKAMNPRLPVSDVDKMIFEYSEGQD